MPLVLKDRVKETTTTTSTGTYTLAGAVTGYQSFSVIGDTNTTYYTVTNGTDWEVGIGTYTASGTTLSRDTILESSNSGNAVNWGAGSKDVFVTYPAERSMYVDGTAITPATTARLAFANLAQGTALSVLGVTGNATADNASIVAGTDHQVLRRSGTSVAFGAVNLAQTAATTGTLPTSRGGTGTTSTTGSGSVVFSGSPTFTGTVTTAAIAMADNLLTRSVLQDYAVEGSAVGNTGASRTLDLTVANFFSATLDQACTFTFSNPPASGDFGTFVLELTNGGAFTITWPASVDWPNGSAPSLTVSGKDQLVFTTRDAGTTWFGFVAGQDIK